ncbi:hypothetical protein ACHAXT_004606 [Thalassiosira profunda]
MNPNQPHEYSPDDFLYGPALGEGRFGSVIYAELKDTASADAEDAKPSASADGGHRRQGYAIKTITKSEALKHDHLQIVMTEKHILTEVLRSESDADGSELLMKLLLLFHDKHCIYFVLELCAGGTLHDLIQSRSANISDANAAVFDISWARYYAGQLLRAIEYMHQRGVVHRDVSPRNIGLTSKGEIKLGDFGAAAVFVKHDCGDGTYRLKRWVPPGSRPLIEEFDNCIGTADYVSPEMIRGRKDDANQSEAYKEYPAMDLWSFGCIVYELFIGKSPFHAGSDHLAFQSVLEYARGKRKMFFPPAIPVDAANIISTLLLAKPSERLGMQDGVLESSIEHASRKKQYQSIRDASFWSLVAGGPIEPPCTPKEPDWMADLRQGQSTLKPLEKMRFDL